MNRIYTSTDATKMITVLLCGQRAIYEHLVYGPVGSLGFFAHMNKRITTLLKKADPQPARNTLERNSRVNLNLLKQTSHASQKRMAPNGCNFARFTFASNDVQTIFTLTAQARTFPVEVGAWFFRKAFAALFGWDRIWKGHHCLQTGDVDLGPRTRS